MRIFYLKSLFTKHPWTNTGLSFVFFFFFLKGGEARRKERNAFRERQLGVDFLSKKTTDHPESRLFPCSHQSCRLDVTEALISLMCFMKYMGRGKTSFSGEQLPNTKLSPLLLQTELLRQPCAQLWGMHQDWSEPIVTIHFSLPVISWWQWSHPREF